MALPLSLTTVKNPTPGWYRGDFHCHTDQSDGVHPPPELVQIARREGLDFFFITDHNTVSAYALFGDDLGVLILPGIEATYKRGHFNVFGVTEAGAWLDQVCGGYVSAPADTDRFPTINALLGETAARGLLNSLNHPRLAPWAWEFPETDLSLVHCLEIWNDPSWPDNGRDNPRAVEMWTRWLNAGWRIPAIGGSDYHRPQPPAGQDKPAERLGRPSTYVYAANLSGAAILEAVRARRAYMSMGPRVAFTASLRGETFGIGDDLGAAAGLLTLTAEVADCLAPAQARLLKNGRPLAEAAVADGRAALTIQTELTPDEAAWFRLDVQDADGLWLALTNPIFAGPPPAPGAARTFGDFV